MNKITKIKKFVTGSSVGMIVAGLLVAGVASAAILSVYTTMTGESEVKQSVVFDGYNTEHSYDIGNSPAHAGNTYVDNDRLHNTSETTAPIRFVTTYAGPDHNGWWSNQAGVETSYWNTLKLENKNSEWKALDSDEKFGTLTYKLVGPKFDYEFEAEGLTSGESYSLIYYADKQNRWEDFGGDNPGALIGEFTADGDGNISEEGNKNLAMNLPHADDWNGSSEANYCNEANGIDDYDLCRGAKIWLVPSEDYDEGNKKVKDSSWSDTSNFLFETDMITYDDSDTDKEALYLGPGILNFSVKTVFDVAVEPGDYQVKTEVQPVQ